MNKTAGTSRSSLFLIEMLIVTLVLSWGSASCVRCFVNAHVMGQKTRELNNAVAIATGFAEVMRGTDGDIDSIIAVFPEAVKGDGSYFTVFYDADFNPCDADNAVYASDVTLVPTGAIQNMHIKVANIKGNDIIYELDATKYMNKPKG